MVRHASVPPIPVVKARRDHIEAYQRNGLHVRVVLMPKSSHYMFVDRTREVVARMFDFLQGSGR